MMRKGVAALSSFLRRASGSKDATLAANMAEASGLEADFWIGPGSCPGMRLPGKDLDAGSRLAGELRLRDRRS